MNRSRLLSAVIALLAITSLSVASTTLETSLTTDPDEEINPDWENLPIGQNDAAAIQESIEGGGGEGGGGESAAGAGGGSIGGSGSAADDRSLLDRLLALLSRLFRLLLPIVAILGVAAVAYRYRGALVDFFGRDSRTTPAAEPRPAAGRWPGTDPEHDVDRAWVEVIRRLDPDRPETTTPDECRALARARGVDRDAVESIVSAFEHVHYGGRSVDAEIDRAREGLRALEGGVK
ncbi:hypothetical protein C461_01452 [Halorubrum aidingense JCM 13560]|uniref:Protein-glutamine gamma-glutamyltransferase-like C-terminal domain-containing protein n=1 Tax=Halorubrum aidingense JCM 13560 TaxID=1230454 RepID=M0PMX9_9EURY|nr:DUF4129 domain-containing protein [Halorubrum aidingense]EMA70105.1 hypothetical protein C461_01452 [Halorubrum aidingense JCM 13560]